jgi:hypothetical protein
MRKIQPEHVGAGAKQALDHLRAALEGPSVATILVRRWRRNR